MSGASFGRIEIEIDGDGPPIVFLHGLGATSSSFQPLLSALHGFRCIRADFPGTGRSARSYVPVTIDFLCETARDIVKGIAGAPAHIVAHSMGTLVAQHLLDQRQLERMRHVARGEHAHAHRKTRYHDSAATLQPRDPGACDISR